MDRSNPARPRWTDAHIIESLYAQYSDHCHLNYSQGLRNICIREWGAHNQTIYSIDPIPNQ
jgi:hypothetical protein